MPKTDFWTSGEGIKIRTAMLSEYVVWRTVNNAIQIYATEATMPGEVVELEWITEVSAGTCQLCLARQGKRYRKGQFMPDIPVHPNCFTGDVPVRTLKGLKRIDHVEKGDYVFTHKGRFKPVVELYKNKVDTELCMVKGHRMTGNHPLLTPQGWMRVDRLENGDEVYFLDSGFNSDPQSLTLTPINIDNTSYEGFVYNLSVADDHSYLVGHENMVVHNCRCHWSMHVVEQSS